MDSVSVIKFEEGFRATPYNCSLGYPTIGYGQKIGDKGTHLGVYQFTVSESTATQMLLDEVDHIIKSFMKLGWYSKLNPERKAIIISMAYQMGVVGLLKFKNMIAALDHNNYEKAAKEMLNSLWAVQTPARAERHNKVMLSGSFEGVY